MTHPVPAVPAWVDDQELPVYVRLGGIVRALHDTLREIGVQDVLTEAGNEFPSARERLIHIAQLTEKAANTVLGHVEHHKPRQESLASQAAGMAAAINADPGFASSPLAVQMLAFLRTVEADSSQTSAALSDIMMAQDFQDLTGQLIKKVVGVIERTETELINLLLDASPPGAALPARPEELTAGPGAPGSVALNQSNVDDLLAELGF